MSDEVYAEARAVVASARALIEDLLEEGVESFERSAVEAAPAVAPSSAEHPPEARRSPARAQQPAAPATTTEATPARADGSQSGAPRLARPTPREGPTRGAPPPADPGSPAPTPPADPGAPIEWGAHPTLEEVRAHLGDCSRCGLSKGRTTLVFGDGNPQADLMFVGEGPGEQEDKSGLPFVGRAGELLTQMIEKGLGTPRSAVYICNIVKCRPPNNRNPLADEVATCRPFLDGQIAAVKPKVIVALGKPAASLLLGRDVAITRVRGTWQEYQGIPVMPTFHPAFILRQYTPENRRLVWEDLKAANARASE